MRKAVFLLETALTLFALTSCAALAGFTQVSSPDSSPKPKPDIPLESSTNILVEPPFRGWVTADRTLDNYGRLHLDCLVPDSKGYISSPKDFEVLLAEGSGSFKGTVFVPRGEASNGNSMFRVRGDGVILYTSPQFTKTSKPLTFDIDISGVSVLYIDVEIDNQVELIFSECVISATPASAPNRTQTAYPDKLLKELEDVSGETDAKWSEYPAGFDTYGTFRYNCLKPWTNDSWSSPTGDIEVLIGGKYNSFRGTVFVPENARGGGYSMFRIRGDGKILYTSPQIDRRSQPINFEIDVAGVTDFRIEVADDSQVDLVFSDAGFCVAPASSPNGSQPDYPDLLLKDATDISNESLNNKWSASTSSTDNYGKFHYSCISPYSSASWGTGTGDIEVLLDSKYNRFKGVVYVAQGEHGDGTFRFAIKGDGQILYESPEIRADSHPLQIPDIMIAGINTFRIEVLDDNKLKNVVFSDCGFYY
ncbi:MAG: NPCBM/NEW2 domain-containing protein [Clostridiales bacterium]|nr:NPCBM/NEW2 domain-containing protein [Clostridiales bacterium]